MFDQRITKLRKLLSENKLDGMLVSSVSNVVYLTGYSNFSRVEREAYLLITKNDQFVLTDGRYADAVKDQVRHFKVYGLNVRRFKKDIGRLGVEEDVLTVSEHKALSKHFGSLKHIDLGYVRSIKTKDEIKQIEQAAELGDRAFGYILKKIKAGVFEEELAHQLEFFIKKQGGDLSFPPIVAFGKNSSIPHHQTGNTKLKDGNFILLDFGVKIDKYCSDMTRTIFFGKPNAKQIKIYRLVLEAQQKAKKFINTVLKSGREIKAKEVDRVARRYIKSKGFPTIPHSLGHGIGLEVHEHPSLSPKSRDILKEGMVFSIEPGIYLPEFGGVRIEDLFVLEKGGLRKITKSPSFLEDFQVGK